MFEELQKIEYYHFQIEMTATGECHLNKWLGSAIRGAFGAELINNFCIDRQMKCEKCSDIFSDCSARILLKSSSSSDSKMGINPYIIYCQENCYKDGTITFELTLFAEGIHVVRDVLKVLARGLRIGRRRTLFKLTRITDMRTLVTIFDGVLWVEPPLHNFNFRELPTDSVTVNFISPFISKQSKADFDYLIRAILRRASAILKQSGIEFNWDFKKIAQRAQGIKQDSNMIKIVNVSRYSNRSNSHMNLSGIAGSAIYTGNINGYLRLIEFAEIFHVGKLCVMGLGKIECT
ncbi:MAG: CRISPR system precrRNA processing endoribonuclease RAMP protein Cas6 [Clostridiales bacterium]|nr:CRISPR system precrRNA processing endoribonuclease RAMP protein Cas6 [Clostridiales bacterium]